MTSIHYSVMAIHSWTKSWTWKQCWQSSSPKERLLWITATLQYWTIPALQHSDLTAFAIHVNAVHSTLMSALLWVLLSPVLQQTDFQISTWARSINHTYNRLPNSYKLDKWILRPGQKFSFSMSSEATQAINADCQLLFLFKNNCCTTIFWGL